VISCLLNDKHDQMTLHVLEIDSGLIEASSFDDSGVQCFRGLPYAAPPVGNLRWKPPQPVAPWKGVRPVGAFGFNAPQRVVFPDIDPFVVGVSEDCLYLNVWTPGTKGKKHAVLFYIHGGGFAVGAASEPRYDGSWLASQGIVVVTANMRLNALGLLAHPALSIETGSSGNFALLDLVAALQWVKRNISVFGGNPDQVTIAGESAGSMFVSMLMASPLAKGLFHGAIGESGAQFPTPERPMPKLVDAEKRGLAFATQLGATTANDLRAVPVEKILDAHPGVGFWPIVDGHFLAETPEAIFKAGRQSDVTLLAGWNKDEGTNFDMRNWNKAAPRFEDIVKLTLPGQAESVFAHYPKDDLKSSRDLGGDLVINNGTWRWLEAQRATGRADVFRYRFDRAPEMPKGKGWFDGVSDPGAFHSCEIPYVFNTLGVFPWLTNEDDQKVADLIGTYVVNFVKAGNPNGSGLPAWPSYREATRPVLNIDVHTSIEHDPARERHAFLASLIT
jgi:para-nitrobenzyl esterase